jgi:hypothetical protein
MEQNISSLYDINKICVVAEKHVPKFHVVKAWCVYSSFMTPSMVALKKLDTQFEN